MVEKQKKPFKEEDKGRERNFEMMWIERRVDEWLNKLESTRKYLRMKAINELMVIVISNSLEDREIMGKILKGLSKRLDDEDLDVRGDAVLAMRWICLNNPLVKRDAPLTQMVVNHLMKKYKHGDKEGKVKQLVKQTLEEIVSENEAVKKDKELSEKIKKALEE